MPATSFANHNTKTIGTVVQRLVVLTDELKSVCVQMEENGIKSLDVAGDMGFKKGCANIEAFVANAKKALITAREHRGDFGGAVKAKRR